jgi:phosphatidylserine decarboxylase
MGDEPVVRISIFLSLFNVHINRVPVTGKVDKLVYIPGKFLNASLDKASTDNERQLVKMTAAYKDMPIAFAQIAGLVARRVLCDLKEGEQVKAGERFGLVRFGSRVDVYLPKGVESLVVCGQEVVGGETVLADLSGKTARKGEVR